MIPTLTYHDRPDHILEIATSRDARGRRVITKRRLPKPHTLGESARSGRQALPAKEPRRIPPKRTGYPTGAASPNRPAPRPKPTFIDCAHLVGNTGATTPHKCGGCSGNQFTSVWECGKFGDCAPLAWAPVPDSEVRRCVDCPSYKPLVRLP